MSTLSNDGQPDLRESVEKSLAENTITARQPVKVAVEDGVVVLTGVVSSFYLKQMCQEAIRETLARFNPRPAIRNQIEVIAK